MNWKIIIIVLGFAALLFTGYRLTLGGGEVSSGNNATFPDGIHYLCGAKTCGHGFTITVAELAEHHSQHYGEPYPCSKCGSAKTIRAERCPDCGGYYPSSRDGNPPCPHCKAEQTTVPSSP